MQSTLMGTSHHSQDAMSDGQSVGSGGRRARQSKQNFQLAKKQSMDIDEQKKKMMNDSMTDLQPLKMDDQGFQLMEKDLELNVTQRLQMRIAKARGIQIDNLRSQEFNVLKQYKQLEKREELLNKMDDFFDQKYIGGMIRVGQGHDSSIQQH